MHYSTVRQPAPIPDQAVLTFIGRVRTPRVLLPADLRDFPQATRRLTLVCAAAAPHPKQWNTRDWSGVPLATLLDAVEVDSNAQSIEVAGYGGATAVFSLTDLGDALLALDVDGGPLSARDGFPARLLIPGQPACAMPRFVQRIAFRAEAAPVLSAAKPLAIIDAVESVDGGVRLHGRALHTDAVAVRLEDGWPVRVTMPIAPPGIAADWTLDWPGLNARQASFTVQALPDLDNKGERPLARRWTSAHDHWTPQRSGGR